MMQINIGDHSSRVPGYVAFPPSTRPAILWARDRARWIASNIKTANPYFRSLPLRRSLTEILGHSGIWINYSTSFSYYGETEFAGGSEIAIGEYCYRIGKWTVLATLIHELAHANGVASSHAAERAVYACGLGGRSERRGNTDDPQTPYNPNIIGMIEQDGKAWYA